jgi:hypothetical protein
VKVTALAPIEAAASMAITHELDGDDEAALAYLGDIRVVIERPLRRAAEMIGQNTIGIERIPLAKKS